MDSQSQKQNDEMILQADTRWIPLRQGCVQCVVTSPPYWGLRDYGIQGQIGLESTPDEYVATIVGVFREIWRVLRDDGTVWLNLGDCFYNYRPGLGQRLSAQTVAGHSRDEPTNCPRRGEQLEGLKEKDLIGIPWRVAFALQADGWYLRSDIIWAKPNPMPESVEDRPTRSHEYIFLLTKNERYYYDAAAIRELSVDTTPRNKRDVWSVNSEATPGAHFATFPKKLIEPCILAGSQTGDLVLDPFIGSGTVGEVSERFGRRWVGLELNPDYIRIAKKRTAQRGLFFGE